MTRRMRARLILIARRARQQDIHEASRKRDTFFALSVLLIVLFGAPLADWFVPTDLEAGTDPATPMADLSWLHDAPDLWTVEHVDLPPNPHHHDWTEHPPTQGRGDVWKKIPAGGESWPTTE